LGSVRVKEGEETEAGAIIGTAGNTVAMENYGLHFEVRLGGLARDPLLYLKRS
jgi:murein DD-endopeptidase MepM/ murein hydrolase activator NlpD